MRAFFIFRPQPACALAQTRDRWIAPPATVTARCEQPAEVRPLTKDRYGRTVGRTTCDDIEANSEQVRSSMAWVFDKYVTDRALYAVQDKARAARRGRGGAVAGRLNFAGDSCEPATVRGVSASETPRCPYTAATRSPEVTKPSG
ncbi:MAG: thermonuclease family protein [Betaproteobacteria bacterium]|nr:thermonuclease family protein [Betaproteobacteria bacterium]